MSLRSGVKKKNQIGLEIGPNGAIFLGINYAQDINNEIKIAQIHSLLHDFFYSFTTLSCLPSLRSFICARKIVRTQLYCFLVLIMNQINKEIYLRLLFCLQKRRRIRLITGFDDVSSCKLLNLTHKIVSGRKL